MIDCVPTGLLTCNSDSRMSRDGSRVLWMTSRSVIVGASLEKKVSGWYVVVAVGFHAILGNGNCRNSMTDKVFLGRMMSSISGGILRCCFLSFML
jgi:hypothetical protein